MKTHSKGCLVYAKGFLNLNFEIFFLHALNTESPFPPSCTQYDMILQGLLEGVSQTFTKDFHFIDSVKAYLSYALLRASVSQSPVIFQVCMLNNHYLLSHSSEIVRYLSLIVHFLLTVRNWNILCAFVAIQGKS